MKDFTVREVESAGAANCLAVLSCQSISHRDRASCTGDIACEWRRPRRGSPSSAGRVATATVRESATETGACSAAAWLRLDLKLDPVKTVVHAPAAGHLSVDELRKLLTVKRRLAQSALAPELIEPAPRLHGHGDLHLGSKAPSVPDLGSGRCAYSEVTLKLRVAPTSSMGYRELTSLKTLAPSMSFLKCGSRRYKEAPQRHPCSRSRGLAGPSTEAQHHPAIFVENSLH